MDPKNGSFSFAPYRFYFTWWVSEFFSYRFFFSWFIQHKGGQETNKLTDGIPLPFLILILFF